MEGIIIFLKGIWVGGTLSIPGVSGGSMAMALGVYERLIGSLNGLFQKKTNKKACLYFLVLFALGGGLGILLISKTIINLLNLYPLYMVFLFTGAVLGGSRVILREINKSVLKAINILYPLFGILSVISIASLPENFLNLKGSGILQWISQIIGGLIAGAALVLPGISISHVLYILGLYGPIFTYLDSFDLLPLIPFLIGLILGTILISKVLGELFLRFKNETYLTTLGFIIGSVIILLKSVSLLKFDYICAALFIIGFTSINLLTKKRTQ